MPEWKIPPKAKVYEALGAVADGRVHLLGPRRAEVASSSGERTYSLTWSEDAGTFSSNDNASYWHNSMGYPIIAVLLARGQLDYDPALAVALAGIPWKRLVDANRHDYDQAVEVALRGIEERGGDRAAITAHVDAIYEQLGNLKLERGPRGAPLPRPSQARLSETAELGQDGPGETDFSRLKRPRHPMPADVRQAIEERALMDAYRARPPYQQNDYLSWIGRAKRPETRARRLEQMLAELAAGGVYMNMKHPGSTQG